MAQQCIFNSRKIFIQGSSGKTNSLDLPAIASWSEPGGEWKLKNLHNHWQILNPFVLGNNFAAVARKQSVKQRQSWQLAEGGITFIDIAINKLLFVFFMNQVFHIREKLLTLQLIVFNHTTLVVLVLSSIPSSFSM